MSTYKLKFNRTNHKQVIMDLALSTEGAEDSIESTMTLEVGDVPTELVNGDGFMSLASYGLLKLVQDRNSQLSVKYLSEQGLTGKDAIQARMDAYKETFDILASGQYKAATVRNSSAIDPIFAEALAQMKGVDAATMSVKLKALTKDERKALKALPQVIEKMAEVRKQAQEAEEISFDDMI